MHTENFYAKSGQHTLWPKDDAFAVTEPRSLHRWWGWNASAGQKFWHEPCLTIQLSLCWPWLRVAPGTRLRNDRNWFTSGHIATVDSWWSAHLLLGAIRHDIDHLPDGEHFPQLALPLGEPDSS